MKNSHFVAIIIVAVVIILLAIFWGKGIQFNFNIGIQNQKKYIDATYKAGEEARLLFKEIEARKYKESGIEEIATLTLGSHVTLIGKLLYNVLYTAKYDIVLTSDGKITITTFENEKTGYYWINSKNQLLMTDQKNDINATIVGKFTGGNYDILYLEFSDYEKLIPLERVH